MGIHPYCLLPRGSGPPPGLRGVGDGVVSALPVGKLSVWVSELGSAPVATVDALRKHDEVITAALSGERTPLPIRFGSWAESKEVLVARTRERSEAFEDVLKKVSGSSEYGVRILERGAPGPSAHPGPSAVFGPSADPDEPADPDSADPRRPVTGPGLAYMEELAKKRESRARRRRRSEALREALRETTGEYVQETWMERGVRDSCLLSVAHLVRRTEGDRYRAAVSRFQEDHRDLRVIATGPWAPYSFAP